MENMIKDYTSNIADEGNTHYNGVPSMYGRMVEDQNKKQPDYCWPGADDGQMHGEHRNEQKGP
jgi:hypothetical protein